MEEILHQLISSLSMFIPLFTTRFCISQVVQDFFHQQYVSSKSVFWFGPFRNCLYYKFRCWDCFWNSDMPPQLQDKNRNSLYLIVTDRSLFWQTDCSGRRTVRLSFSESIRFLRTITICSWAPDEASGLLGNWQPFRRIGSEGEIAPDVNQFCCRRCNDTTLHSLMYSSLFRCCPQAWDNQLPIPRHRHRQHTHETQWVNDQNEAIQTSHLGITSSYLGNLRKRFHVPFSKRNNIFGIELHLIQAFQQSPPSCVTRRRKSNAPQPADFKDLKTANTKIFQLLWLGNPFHHRGTFQNVDLSICWIAMETYWHIVYSFGDLLTSGNANSIYVNSSIQRFVNWNREIVYAFISMCLI